MKPNDRYIVSGEMYMKNGSATAIDPAVSIVTDSSLVSRSEWEEFVEGHPCGTVFHTPEMAEVYLQLKGCRPLSVFAFRNGRLCGLYLSVIYENGSSVGAPLTRRSISMGGPLFPEGDDSLKMTLVESCLSIASDLGCIYSEIRPVLKPVDDYSSFGFEREGHLNIVLDISKGEEELYKGLHKERRRNIARAEKAGLEFRELSTAGELDCFTALIKKTYRRKQVPFSYPGLFTSACEKCGKYIRFFGAYHGSKMIACQARLFYKDLVYAWYAGSDDDYFKERPNDFLTWKVLLWAGEHGYSTFDFGGGGKPGVPYGVRDYKMKYGCLSLDYGRYKVIHKPLLYKLGEAGYSVIHRTR